MAEKERRNPIINYEQIANFLVSSDIGNIFGVQLPSSAEFTNDDFCQIHDLFKELTFSSLTTGTNFLDVPGFILSLDDQNLLTFYKDTAYNLRIFRYFNNEIENILTKNPANYPAVINMLVEEISPEEREEIYYIPAHEAKQCFTITTLEDVSASVLKALVRLTDDPRKTYLL